ncbi:hypothetical protein AMTRI_Chr04g190290 [Amborella trichopoda]
MSSTLSLTISLHTFPKTLDFSTDGVWRKKPLKIAATLRESPNQIPTKKLHDDSITRTEPESPQEASSSRMSYSRFLEYLDQGAVKKVDLFENGNNPVLNKIQRVREKDVDFAVHPLEINMTDAILNLLGNLAFPLLLLGALFLRSSQLNNPGGTNLPFGLERSKAMFQTEPNTGVTFDDVAEIADFLKTPEKFSAIGARIPKGVLLVRPPGTGKTLLAKAIAGEAGTLNQLLTEMDGFDGNTGVIVIAATNRPEISDQALLRPGRFDRQVTVCLPDVRGSEEILKVHTMRTPGFSGADLANLMSEAAILAGRRGKEKITVKEIDDSIDRIVAEMEGTQMTDGKSKILVAYHEIGHAIGMTLQKVALIPRGQACGLTWFIPGDDPTLVSKQQILTRIVGGLGGRAAEEVIFGESEVTTSAARDLQQVTQVAKQIRSWSLTEPAAQSSDVVLRMLARNSMSEKLAEDIDKSVKIIIGNAYEIAKNHIRNNRAAMDKLVEKETLTGDEFRVILSEFTEFPVDKASISPASVLVTA